MLLISGTFAIICLLTGKVVSTQTNAEVLSNGTVVPIQNQYYSDDQKLYTNIDVAVTVTFTAAVMQVRTKMFNSISKFLFQFSNAN